MATGISLGTKGIICGSTVSLDSTSCIQFGEIQLEEDRWQLISVPQRFGYWDSVTHKIVNDNVTVATVKNFIVEQLEDKYVTGAETIGDYVETINTYIGDVNAFYTWNSSAPPPDSSPHNFPLIYNDNGREEICGIWVYTRMPGTDMILEWDNS